MFNLILKNRIILLLTLMISSIVIAQDSVDTIKAPLDSLITLNALEKMKQPVSFKQQSIVARLMASQTAKIDQGVLTAFESRCIASNMVIMFGDENAEKFAIITEKAYMYSMESLSQEDINFMMAIQDKYGIYLSLVASECSQPEIKEKNE